MTMKLLFLLAVTFSAASVSAAEVKLTLGNSACHSFPCAYMGTGFFGIQAAFLAHADAGGSPVTADLLSWDDHYSNTLTKENTVRLLEEQKVWGMIGVKGANAAGDSANVTLIANDAFLCPASGGQSLREPFVEAVVNLRPSYYDEIEAIVRYATKVRGWSRGALLRQSDPYGADTVAMFDIVAEEYGLEAHLSASYNRIEVDVTSALADIMGARPDFVILAAQLPAAVGFIRGAKAQYPDAQTVFFAMHSVDAAELFYTLRALSVDTTNVKATSVLPLFNNASLALGVEFRASMAEYFPGQFLNYGAWEGYASARLFLAAITKTYEVYGTTSKEDLLKTIYRVNPLWNISGLIVGPYTPAACNKSLGPCSCNQGLHTIYTMEFSKESGDLVETENSRWDFASCGTPTLGKDKSITIAVIFSIVAFLVLCTAISALVVFFWKKRTGPQSGRVANVASYVHMESVNSEAAGLLPQQLQSQHPFYEACAEEVMSTTHYISKIDKEELRDMSLIGVGSSAKVYRATWRGTFVAVKQLHYQIDMCMDTMVSELANEIKLWSQLMHPYIVQFLGVTKELWLVMEFMERGPLRGFIKENQLPMRSKLTLLQHSALALEYIHARHIVHRDYNPNNIMVTGPMEHLEAKLADFGLSRPELNSSLRQTLSVGTPVYAAPEVLAHGQFSTKSDVYSFALTLWFIETEEDPLANIKNQFELVRAVVMENKRPPISQCPVLPDLITWCWHSDPNERPAFDLITFTIHQYLRRTATGGSDKSVGSLAVPPLSGHLSVAESPGRSSFIAPSPRPTSLQASSFPDTTDTLPEAAPSVAAILDPRPL